jgi:hypothetical protein
VQQSFAVLKVHQYTSEDRSEGKFIIANIDKPGSPASLSPFSQGEMSSHRAAKSLPRITVQDTLSPVPDLSRRHLRSSASDLARMSWQSYPLPIRGIQGRRLSFDFSVNTGLQVIGGDAYFRNAICSHMYFAHAVELIPPVSVKRACLPMEFSHVARGWKAFAMLLVTQSPPPPLLSLSKYLCTSKMRLVVVPSGFLTAASAAALPSEMNAPALV